MLNIDKKRTDKIDWIKPLQKYISTQYTEESAKEHNDALNTLNQLREDCRNASDKSDAVKDILYRYYCTLAQVEIRFPISEDNVRISFPWNNSFGGKKISLYSLHYERACVLYNYAVVLSQLGAMQNRNSTDGVKLAAGYFQGAAGAFSELKEYASKHPECSGSQDLSSECLSMLLALHLGQAQNCVIEKAIKDGMKDVIVAKLIAQAAEYYDTANTLLNGPLKSTIDRTWAGHVELWTYIHKASFQQKLANVAAETMKYGDQVARLIVADNLMNEAKKKLTRYTPPDLKDIVDRNAAAISKARMSAEKDNDTIYNATVPPESKLEAPEKKALVKASPLPDPPNLQDLFSKLVPYAIKEAAGRYREMKDDLVRKEQQTLEDYNEIAKATLSSLNLPGAIEALETPSGIPPALATKMETVKKENGPSLVVDLMETLRRLAEEDSSILAKAIESLDKEEEEDNKLRTQYGARWPRTPSHTLTPSLRQEAAKYKGHIEHATKSDSFVASKWRDHTASVSLLAGPPGPVIAVLGAGSTATSSADTRPLKKVLSDLDTLIAAREAAKGELQALSQKDDIVMKLLNAPGMSHDQVFGEELRKYETIQGKLRENYVKQDSLLNALSVEHEKFLHARNADTAAQAAREQREQALTKLANSFKVYNELKAGLREGINFYTNLQELLSSFSSKCSDFVLARDTEKTDLLQQIQTPQPPPSQPSAPSAPSAPPQYQAPPSYPQPQTYPGNYMGAPPIYGAYQPPPYGAPQAYPVPPPQYQPPPQYAPPPYGYQQPPQYRK